MGTSMLCVRFVDEKEDAQEGYLCEIAESKSPVSTHFSANHLAKDS